MSFRPNRFDVVGHDRGARTAHRMAFDHPDRVRSVALLDILPTLDVWRTIDDWLGLRYWHWFSLAQPDGPPERMIGQNPIGYLHAALGGLSRPGEPGGLDIYPRALAEYERAARQRDVVRAWCADYRAAAVEDVLHDRADERRTSDIPCLVMWGNHGVVGARLDPVKTWRRRFPNVTGVGLDAGHYLLDERGDDVALRLVAHLQTVGCSRSPGPPLPRRTNRPGTAEPTLSRRRPRRRAARAERYRRSARPGRSTTNPGRRVPPAAGGSC